MNHTQLLHRTTAFFLAVLSLTAALTGCSGKTSDVGQLNVALQTTAQGVPAYIAEVEGIDAQAGLTVSSTVFASGPAQNEALGANEWDVATMGAPPAIMANLAYDARILALVLMEASTEFFVRPGSEIAQVSGAVPGYPQILGDADTWRGKTVLCPVATTSHFILLTLLEMLGLTEADINIINMDVGQAYTAFKAGQGDVVTLWDPVSFSAEDEGWVRAAYGPDIPAYTPCVLVASQKAIDEKPEQVKAWLKTYFDVVGQLSGDSAYFAGHAYDLLNDNNVTITQEESLLFIQRKKFFTLEEAAALFQGESGSTQADQYLNAIADFFVGQGHISQEDREELLADSIFYPMFLEELAGEAG